MKQVDAHFLELIQKHWTSDRIKKVCGGHRYKVLPTNAPVLLRLLGLLNRDGTMSADATRKFSQVNHLLNLFEPQILELTRNIKRPIVVDCGCGNSYLSLLIMWAMKNLWSVDGFVLGIDSNAKLIEQSRAQAETMGWSSRSLFIEAPLDSEWWTTAIPQIAKQLEIPPEKVRPHLLIALHACDTATDRSLAQGIASRADVIAAAPCCQAELARQWKESAAALPTHPLRPLFQAPEIRRQVAADVTDMLRVLLLRANGYETTTTEFIASNHTPKNRLITAVRRGRFLKSAADEYASMKEVFGSPGIALENYLNELAPSSVGQETQ